MEKVVNLRTLQSIKDLVSVAANLSNNEQVITYLRKAERLLDDEARNKVQLFSAASRSRKLSSEDEIVNFFNHFKFTLGLKYGVSKDATLSRQKP